MREEMKYNPMEKLIIYGISSLVGMLIVFLSLLLSAALMLAGDLPEFYASVISAVCVGIGAMSSGFISSKKIMSGGIINGLICGGIIYAVILFISLFLSDNGFSMITVYHLLITLLSSAIGGVLGVY